MQRKNTVVIIQDNESRNSELAGFIDRSPYFETVGTATEGVSGYKLIKKQKPDFVVTELLLGGYDKMVMDKGEEAIEREFARLLPTARQSGFLVSCDHQTPPAVTLDDYALYLKAFREFAAEACR